MANPNPSPETRFKPGNQFGKLSKRGPSISTRLAELIEQHGLTDTVGLTLLGAAIGDEKLLKGRKPNAAFMAMLLERLEGKVKDGPASDETEDPPATDEQGSLLEP